MVFTRVAPLHFGMPSFDPIMALTLLRIKATGMFLALGDITGRKVVQLKLPEGSHTDGLGAGVG
jgi:NCS2 family nucleobase:cation symporter-2